MRRKRNPTGYRKRQSANVADSDSRSAVLRAIGDAVQRRDFPGALSQIDQQIAANPADTVFQSKLLALTADCLYKQGKFADAATAYTSVSEVVQGQPPTMLLRSALGTIRSQLKDVQIQQASDLADGTISTANTFSQQYAATLSRAPSTLASSGQIVIPGRPPSPVAVASRLGKAFLSEGELDTARLLFQQALAASPNTCRARVSLAEIALRSGDAAKAANLAKEAIQVGMFQAKTVQAWRVLVAASGQTGSTGVNADLMDALGQAAPSIRARAILVIVKTLRNQSDPSWKQIADNWLQQEGATNPIIAAELRKIELAHSRRYAQGSPSEQLRAAQQLLQTPSLGPREWLAATKEVVRSSLLLNQDPNIPNLIDQGKTRYGQALQPAFTQALALACKKAGRTDLATGLFQQNINSTAISSADLGKSLWALAKMQAEQGNYTDAAASYWAYSQRMDMPQRFSLYALLEWTRCVLAANQPDQLAQAQPLLDAALAQITDYELVLDLARQILRSPLDPSYAMQVFEQGQQLALQAFDACPHPSPAATILFKLCRRANDFQAYDSILNSWTRLTPQQQQWLWSERGDFWNYLELIFRAYRDSQQEDDGEAFINNYLNDPATPPQGYAVLGVSYATMKRTQREFDVALSVYKKMSLVAPTSEWSSVAYYWLGLQAWSQATQDQLPPFGDRILLALGNDWGLAWKKDMAARAWCFKADLDPTQVPAQVTISQDTLQKQAGAIQKDFDTLVNS